ncbi:20941_t:CDS:2 [Cetraspora pellucida]|uniref:20941_t:CDS:1 n=1 Tax=Cetraspora pellucida TaxID=1433469 RepID=A0A9N9CER4_9GLOM|nr:20941_t:CDS:2 [Cetraspora pellucida]
MNDLSSFNLSLPTDGKTKNARCGTTSSLISNWLSSSAYISMQKYRPIAYIGGMTLVALVSMWIFMQQTHITECDSDSEDSNDPNDGFSSISRERITSTTGSRKRTRDGTSQKIKINNSPIPASRDSKQLKDELDRPQSKFLKFRTRGDINHFNKKSKPSLTEVNNDNVTSSPIIGSCGCVEDKTEAFEQNKNINYQNLQILGKRSRSSQSNRHPNGRLLAETTYIHDTFYTNAKLRGHKADTFKNFDEANVRRIESEVNNAINDLQGRISIALNKIKSTQIDEVICDHDDIMNLEPSPFLSTLENIEQSRFDRDAHIATQLEKQTELEDDVEFILKMIKGSNYSDSNGENWISNNYSEIPVNVNNSPKSGKKVVTFATLASDIGQASQHRILRNFEILEILKQKELTEKIIEGSLKGALEIVKAQSLARARSTRRLKRPHKISYEIDDVNKKLLYIDSWQKDMIDRLDGLECEFDVIEKMIDDDRILTESFEAKTDKDGEG